MSAYTNDKIFSVDLVGAVRFHTSEAVAKPLTFRFPRLCVKDRLCRRCTTSSGQSLISSLIRRMKSLYNMPLQDITRLSHSFLAILALNLVEIVASSI